MSWFSENKKKVGDVITTRIHEVLKTGVRVSIDKDKKLITNSGYFQDHNHQLNSISKTTASHSTLTLDNSSTCSFKKISKGPSFITKGFKTFDNNFPDI